MKLNLNCGEDVRSGYLNIDLSVRDLSPDLYVSGDVIELDWVCDDNTADEIIAINVLETVSFNLIENMLKNWAKKLSPNGVLKLSIIDLYIVCKLFVEVKITLEDLIGHLWGQNGQVKMSAINRGKLCELIEQKIGLKITLQRYDGIAFYLEAMKNEN